LLNSHKREPKALFKLTHYSLQTVKVEKNKKNTAIPLTQKLASSQQNQEISSLHSTAQKIQLASKAAH